MRRSGRPSDQGPECPGPKTSRVPLKLFLSAPLALKNDEKKQPARRAPGNFITPSGRRKKINNA
jgi:hypothetical protein